MFLHCLVTLFNFRASLPLILSFHFFYFHLLSLPPSFFCLLFLPFFSHNHFYCFSLSFSSSYLFFSLSHNLQGVQKSSATLTWNKSRFTRFEHDPRAIVFLKVCTKLVSNHDRWGTHWKCQNVETFTRQVSVSKQTNKQTYCARDLHYFFLYFLINFIFSLLCLPQCYRNVEQL